MVLYLTTVWIRNLSNGQIRSSCAHVTWRRVIHWSSCSSWVCLEDSRWLYSQTWSLGERQMDSCIQLSPFCGLVLKALPQDGWASYQSILGERYQMEPGSPTGWPQTTASHLLQASLDSRGHQFSRGGMSIICGHLYLLLPNWSPCLKSFCMLRPYVPKIPISFCMFPSLSSSYIFGLDFFLSCCFSQTSW